MRTKEVLAAGIIQDLLFFSEDRLEVYLSQLDHRHMKYEVLDTFFREDGSVIIRIVKQYNGSDLIQL